MELENTAQIPISINIDIPKIANKALDFGLKTVLPDFIEDEVIQIKDAFIKEGFIAGLEEAKQQIDEVWKSVKGIFTGEFDNIGQIKKLVQKDGILDTASTLVDKITKKLLDNKIITKQTYNIIKTGKKEIINALEEELNKYYKIDEYDIEKLEKQIQDWQESFQNKDYESMEKISKKISETLLENQTIEKTINKARNIEKLQKYIQEKGSIEKLSKEERKLLETTTIQ